MLCSWACCGQSGLMLQYIKLGQKYGIHEKVFDDEKPVH
jgi:hypothetical protein